MVLKDTKKRSTNKNVLLITEGTYPYNYGGVSSWSHTLCKLTQGIDYTIYSLNAFYENAPKYELPDSVKKVVQVPLWASYPLCDIMDYEKSYSNTILRKTNTTDEDIKHYFLTSFTTFVSNLIGSSNDLNTFEKSIYELWDYFKQFDFDQTMANLYVWNTFKKIVEDEFSSLIQQITLSDISFSLQYITKLLLPLAIPVPPTDIAHITLAGLPIFPALIAKRKYNASILATEHGVFIRENMINISSSSLSFFSKKLIIKCSETISKLAYAKSDIVTSVNKFNTQWEFHYGLKEHKSKVIYNGVDENRFSTGEKPTHLKNVPTVVAIARIFALKDIITMIKTCGYVKQQIPNIKFIVYGDKKADIAYVNECETLIKELNLNENFILAGHHSQPNKAFLEGDISILTSISEGFPYTVIESMSCGIPVVATDVGGVAEAITPNTGYVCKPKDFETLGEKVVLLLKDNELRLAMGKASRERVLEHFTIQKIIKSYEELYDNLIPIEKSSVKIEPVLVAS